MNPPQPPSIVDTARKFWSERSAIDGPARATRDLAALVWEFVRDSTPDRLRARFGDAEYDWDHRVNTTSGAVGWRDRLLGMFHSAYQPTDPAAFHEMLDALEEQILRRSGLDLRDFTFLDLGSGKGRTLLMASDYPFRQIVGVELLPSLHEIAEENLGQYKNDAQKCFALESICADATTFPFPDEPLVVYLFNPLPEGELRQSIANLQRARSAYPQPTYVLYHNPLLQHVLEESGFRRIIAAEQYSAYAG
jgi:hypothetical protein